MSTTTLLLPFQPDTMSPAQLAAVSYLAQYSASTHLLYTYQLRRWFDWREVNHLDPLVGVQRGHDEASNLGRFRSTWDDCRSFVMTQ